MFLTVVFEKAPKIHAKPIPKRIEIRKEKCSPSSRFFVSLVEMRGSVGVVASNSNNPTTNTQQSSSTQTQPKPNRKLISKEKAD